LLLVYDVFSVVEFNKPVKDKQWFEEQVGEYLKYDGYMYNPLLLLAHSSQGTLVVNTPLAFNRFRL